MDGNPGKNNQPTNQSTKPNKKTQQNQTEATKIPAATTNTYPRKETTPTQKDVISHWRI